MNPAIVAQTTIDIAAGHCLFRAQGTTPVFAGYTILYAEKKEDGQEEEQGGEKLLPPLGEGETLSLQDLKSEQKFTQPPPRFTESSLVRELEENGIGRPSTYANILSTIQDREYVKLEERKFNPTELGMLITELLVKNFPSILNIEFTASLETLLDKIAEGSEKRIDALHMFYDSFKAELDKAKINMRKVKGEVEQTDLICEKCGEHMVKKWGKNGMFLACSAFPVCKNTRDLSGKGKMPPKETDITCNLCEKPMVLKSGKFGPFLGCSAYPECKNVLDCLVSDAGEISVAVSGEDDGIICEKCGAKMTRKRGKFGAFWGCSAYPACNNIIRAQRGGAPKSEPEIAPDVACPNCGKEMFIRSGRFGKFLGCSAYPECKTIVSLKKSAALPKKENTD
jgi:DNA topoisomerase-1